MQDWPLVGLFVSSFVSATLFPGGSEVVLAYLDAENKHSSWLLLSIATSGNTLGGLTSWGIGRWLAHRYPPERVAKPSFQRAQNLLTRYGSPSLLLSWVPVLGDPLCVAAGWLKISFVAAFFWILIGKTIRYAAVMGVV